MSGGDPADDWFDDQHSADNKEEVDQHWESVRFLLHMMKNILLDMPVWTAFVIPHNGLFRRFAHKTG